LTFDLLTLKVVSKSRVTWATSVPILVFLGISILELRPTYATYVIQTSDKSIAYCFRLMGRRHNNGEQSKCCRKCSAAFAKRRGKGSENMDDVL